MTTTVLMKREGDKLGACDSISHEAITAMRHGEQVIVVIKRARNTRHHRKMFALLNIALENQDQYKTIDDLLDATKIATGHCKWIDMLVRGIQVRVAVPKSISFANMGQDKFERFYNDALDYLVSDVLHGADVETIEQEVRSRI